MDRVENNKSEFVKKVEVVLEHINKIPDCNVLLPLDYQPTEQPQLVAHTQSRSSVLSERLTINHNKDGINA